AKDSGSSMTLPVVGEVARRGDLVLSITTTGLVQSDAVASLKTETSGTVLEVLVRPGSRVGKGEPLVQLDPRPFDLALREAEAAVNQAVVRYRDLVIPDSILLGHDLPEERLEIAETRAGLNAARIALEQAKLDRERATLTAPFNGVINEVTVAAGERVSAGQDAVTIVDMDNLHIEAQVLEHDLPLITAGGQAIVTAAAAPDKPVTGRVVAVLPMIDTTRRAGRALIRVRSNGVLRPGMYADVRLEARRLEDRTLVPARAVIERDGRPLVFVVKEGRAQWVYINPGLSNGDETAVLPDSVSELIPVSPGDTVLVEGHLTLTHDVPVRVSTVREGT
ncbi:MAG: efflux RND transporter periplasmic adaptor subunit, partial [Gemmatimonadales bacterium]